ncbi:uncharacterized protein LOC128956163 [Oppia nitens]|uniref:uncharacterized protein LOC128956163 n=1 Tax=Oppia nitens TaxID=1686743 RepID=UPI0023DA09B5|nr:uncharacterized protein LOC128956163 [Oppia nitens]
MYKLICIILITSFVYGQTQYYNSPQNNNNSNLSGPIDLGLHVNGGQGQPGQQGMPQNNYQYPPNSQPISNYGYGNPNGAYGGNGANPGGFAPNIAPIGYVSVPPVVPGGYGLNNGLRGDYGDYGGNGFNGRYGGNGFYGRRNRGGWHRG